MVPRVSVIVPTRNRPGDIRRMLDGLSRNAHLDAIELILVDDGSTTPLTLDESQRVCATRILRNAEGLGPTFSRNHAVTQAAGEIVAFLDDDAVPVPDWIDVMLNAFEHGADAVTGPVLRFDAGLLSRARQARYDKRYAPLRTGTAVRFFTGGNSAVRRELFNRIGGFTSGAVGGDNAIAGDLADIGARVTFLRPMKIMHRNSKGMAQAMRNAYASGRARSESAALGPAIRDLVTGDSAVGKRIDERVLNQLLGGLHFCGIVGGHLTKRSAGGLRVSPR